MFCTSLAEASTLHSRVKKDSCIFPLDLTHGSSIGGRQKKKLKRLLSLLTVLLPLSFTLSANEQGVSEPSKEAGSETFFNKNAIELPGE